MTDRSLHIRPTWMLGAVLCAATLAIPGCSTRSAESAQDADDAPAVAVADTSLPASGDSAMARLEASPRHGEWVMVPAGNGDSVRSWVVYPERKDKAPVVVVIHEIFGLSPWIRAVADQFAAEGFIAIAPDLLTEENIPGAPENPDPDAARAAIRNLQRDDVNRWIDAAAHYAMQLPAARQSYGVVGFCWGGSTSFAYSTHAAQLGAAVVYYGTPPDSAQMANIHAPVLGFYGERDARVSSTVPHTDSLMHALGKPYQYSIFPGAGHGFLRAQSGQEGANAAATRAAWPRTVSFFQQHLANQ
ncbi:MAG TPA: dienelactone hydrolase family protein [Gemmatimonadaceae bacterium]|nr:dienelactone hydrolase family protein [Gemmatimonadaceae bacterium]